MHYKMVVDGYVIMVGSLVVGDAITEDEYNRIHDIIADKPEAGDGYDWMLRDITYTWERVNIDPDEPEDMIRNAM